MTKTHEKKTRRARFGAVLWPIQSGSAVCRFCGSRGYVENRGAPLSLSETEPQIGMKRIEIKKTQNTVLITDPTQSEPPLKRAAVGGANSLNDKNDATNPLINKQ